MRDSFFWGVVFGSLMGGFSGGLTHILIFGSTHVGEKKMQVSAIEAGVAEWTVDAKTGETAFTWKKAN